MRHIVDLFFKFTRDAFLRETTQWVTFLRGTLRNATHCGPVFQIHERCVFERDDTMGHVFERENIKGGCVQEIGARWGEGV